MAASSRNPNKWEKAFQDLPQNQIWRLFIDKRKQSEGEDVFDKTEPGYKNAMLKALEYAKETVGKKLDAEEFKAIHAICINEVKNIPSDTEFKPLAYGFAPKEASEEARKEWSEEKLILPITFDKLSLSELAQFLAVLYRTPNGQSWVEPVAEVAGCKEKINAIFKHYYDEIEKAKSENEKLAAIVSVCRTLEISHFFNDANQRTIAFVILNKLLIENDFSPVILEDPTVFDGYHSRKELVADVKTGMRNFSWFAKKKATVAEEKLTWLDEVAAEMAAMDSAETSNTSNNP